MYLSSFYFAIENERSRTGLVDMVITLAPFYAECTSVHDDICFTTCPASKSGSNGGGAGTCTAGLRNTTATFPNSCPDASVSLNACKFNVTALRECGVLFEDTAGLSHLINIIGKDDIVRITHGDKCSFI